MSCVLSGEEEEEEGECRVYLIFVLQVLGRRHKGDGLALVQDLVQERLGKVKDRCEVVSWIPL